MSICQSEFVESSDDEKEIMEKTWKRNISEIEKVNIYTAQTFYKIIHH